METIILNTQILYSWTKSSLSGNEVMCIDNDIHVRDRLLVDRVALCWWMNHSTTDKKCSTHEKSEEMQHILNQ